MNIKVHIFGFSILLFVAIDVIQGLNFTHQLLSTGAAEGAATAG